jgi:hypothetical protein
MTHLWLDKTPNLGVHQTGSSSRFVAAAAIAAVGSVSSVSCRTNRSSSDAYGNSAAHGCTTIDATAIDTAVMNTNPTNPDASSIGEGVSRNSHDAGDANDCGCGK